MTPDDRELDMLSAAYAKLLQRIPQPNPLKEATPASWATPTHEGAEI